jgi:ComF family protein
MMEMAYERRMKSLMNNKYDLLLAVPLHRRRRRDRQFNQSELLALRLSQLSDIEFLRECLKRTRHTYQQAKLEKDERWHNVKDAFSIMSGNETNIDGKHILLVDDIVTTGATVYEASRPLFATGAVKVDIFSLAYAR